MNFACTLGGVFSGEQQKQFSTMAATLEQMTAEITRMSEQMRALATALDETRRGAAQSHEIIRRLQAGGGDRGDRMTNARTI